MIGPVSDATENDATDAASDEPLSPAREQALAALKQVFDDGELEYKEISPTSLMVNLPGEKKLQTPCRFDVGTHALEVHAFVCRRPDENFAGVYRWLLERNMKMYAVAFALDPMGDIYLDARLPLSAASTDEIDRLLGAVLEYSDGSFNTILELGFASSIRKEWEWRVSRGEPTRNLEAFRGPLGLDELGTPED
jgi:Putative bacterial sensory transduction regulator